MSADTAYRVARTFVAGLVASGVEVVAVGSGSRSTGLVLAVHDDERVRVFSFVDERSAAFFALGAARATGRPAAVVTTSGTAAANLLPAAVEARAAGVPLVLLTADRPPELHDVGAMQTVEQVGLLSPALWTTDLHTEDGTAVATAEHLAAQACAAATGVPAGPVHVNVRFREPLTPPVDVRRVEMSFPEIVRRRRPSVSPDPDHAARIAEVIGAHPRGLIYAGHMEGQDVGLAGALTWLSQASGYPVIAEATSRMRGRLDDAHLVDAAEALVRTPGFVDAHRPDLVLRVGAAPLTRGQRDWLDGSGAHQVVVDPSFPWPDPGRVALDVLAADPAPGCIAIAEGITAAPDDAWAKGWVTASEEARTALEDHLDAAPFFEGTVVRGMLETLPDDAVVYTATSLPIRALDAFAPVHHLLDAYASRGASGIDGTVSAALGAAVSAGRPAVCLSGDLAFLHDVGALMAAARHRIPLVTIVIDNGGGEIFEFLPQGGLIEQETFDDLFSVSHTFDLMHAADLYGIRFASVHDERELHRVLTWAFTEGSPWVVRAEVHRGASVEAHDGAWRAVAEALG